jgi:hypothetical protein
MAETDPCTELARLKDLRTAIVSGQAEQSVRFGDEEVRYFKADLAALDRLIASTERDCAIASGRPAPRRRFARGIRFC